MQIGIISDTHNRLPAEIFTIFKNVDTILHAGDICEEQVLLDLERIAPVRAIFGNMDGFPLVSNLKRIEFFTLENSRICMIHAIRSAKNFAFELLRMKEKADIVVFGHSHVAEVTKFNDILFINPGSASSPRHGTKRSVALLELNGREKNVEIKNY
jgi:putative phosphoesterase